MATKPTTAGKAGPATKGLQVTARRDSFWRAGLQFGPEAKTVSLAEITPDQAEAIRAEGAAGGQLVVVEVDIEPAKG